MQPSTVLACLVAATACAARLPALLQADDGVVINETPCTACTNLLTMVQARLDDPTSQQALMQYVIQAGPALRPPAAASGLSLIGVGPPRRLLPAQDVCPQLPEAERSQCSIFAPLVIASAVGWVREQSPVSVCTRMSLCPDSVRPAGSCSAVCRGRLAARLLTGRRPQLQDVLDMSLKELYGACPRAAPSDGR